MVSLVVLNHESGGFLARTLESLARQTSDAAEVIAVDNGSSGHPSLRLLERARDEGLLSRLVCLPRNEGFAQGMNAGMTEARGDLIVALNSDVYLAPTFVRAVLAAGRECAFGGDDDRVGLLAVPVYRWRYDDGHDDLTDELLGVGVCLVRRLSVGPWHPAFSRPESLLGPDGSVQILTRAGLDAARREAGHVYDPGYGSYGEDIDLYIRLRSLGYRCRPVFDTAAWHIGAASSNSRQRAVEKPMQLQLLAHANKWRTFRKLGRAEARWTALPWMLAEDAFNVLAGRRRLELFRGYVRNYAASVSRRPGQTYPPAALPFAGGMFSRAAKHVRTHGSLPPLDPTIHSAVRN